MGLIQPPSYHDHRICTQVRTLPAWLKAHTDPHGPRLGVTPAGSYTPTGLLKVPGPEQLEEEWIAGKGRRSYERFMVYLRRYAKAHDTTVASCEANEGELR